MRVPLMLFSVTDRVGDGGLGHDMVEGDGFAGHDADAPAETGGEGDFGALDFHQRITDELVEGAVEIAAPV